MRRQVESVRARRGDGARIGALPDVPVAEAARGHGNLQAKLFEFGARHVFGGRRSADVAEADEQHAGGRPDHDDTFMAASARSARARSSSVSTPGGNGSGATRTAIAKPCSSARNRSSDSAHSSGVAGSPAKVLRNPAR